MARNDRYSIDAHKAHLHPERIAKWLSAKDDWEAAKDVFPLYVEVSPVGYCNHRCSFCGVDYMVARKDRPRIGIDLMRDTLTDMATHGVKAVMFAGAGEPLLYKPLVEAILHADAAGLDTSITTNGTLLTEAFARKAFKAARLRWIKVSLNAGTAETYAAIHGTKPEDFERTLRNLENAVRIRGEMGCGVTIGVQILALPESEQPHPRTHARIPSNIPTIRPLAERLRDIGVDYLVVKPYSQHLMSEDSRVYEYVDYTGAGAWVSDVQAVSTDTFRVVVRTETMAEWDACSRRYDKCHATPFLWAYLEADGNVWGCSTYVGRVEGDKEYGDDRFRYGNVNEQSFSEIWRGDRRRANWEYIRSGLDIAHCRVNCRMHHINAYLDRLANPDPHDTFI